MPSLKATLTVGQLTFLAGKTFDLAADAIVVVTGPNNSGKSTFLEEIARQFRFYGRGSGNELIIKEVSKVATGDADDFIEFINQGDLFDTSKELYRFAYGRAYKKETLIKAWESNSLPEALEDVFAVKMEPKDRIGAGARYRQSSSGKDPISHLWDNEAEEIRISQIFSRAFGMDLILDRGRGGGEFKVGSRNQLPSHKKRLTKEFRKFINALPSVSEQGDGLKSFAAIALELLTASKSVTIIDEPELFLHPPQVRHLARLICEETPQNTQVFLATHSADFIKGVLDGANDRVVVVRLKRDAKGHSVETMSADRISELWQDPLFRTSNALTALFHDAAVLVEGESDSRFLRAGMNNLFGEEHLPDMEFFSCNGKGKIHLIASALTSLSVPVVSVVDLDILSNPSDIFKLYSAMGGDPADIRVRTH